jgi:hypothetical protein
MPTVVIRLVDEVGAAVSAGKVRSGWAVLRARLRDADPVANPSVDAPDCRDKAVRWAEQWVRASGVFFDRAVEVDDELFGHLGRLRDWAGDELLRRRMLELWERERPRGVHVEREMEERASRFIEQTRRVEEQLSAAAREAHELSLTGDTTELEVTA